MYRNFFISFTKILLVAQLLMQEPVVCQHTDADDIGLLQALNDTRLRDTIFNPNEFDPNDEIHEGTRCQPMMNIPLCENVPYNSTLLPNTFNHQTLQEVIKETNVFYPLVTLNCSPDLKLFICTVYAPICFDFNNGSRPIHLLPCRSLCESARHGCFEHAKKIFNERWPTLLECERFPDRRTSMCVGREDQPKLPPNGDTRYSREQNVPKFFREIPFVCPKNFEVNSYSMQLFGKTYNNCTLPCDDVLLDRSDAQFVRLTSGIAAIVCLLSTLFTCITFVINTKRFKYPARPIIIIAFCQVIVATCYLIGFVTQNKIACNDPVDPPKSLPNMRMISYLAMGNKKGSCTLQFMAIYFFQMSTVLWWLMMTISWYMIARLKWAPEAVSSVARYFHLFSWAIPALMTIYLSVRGNIEGDSTAGICYVSTSNQESIKYFVIYPTLACLGLGFLFLASGFKSIWDSWETLRHEYGRQTDEHTKLVFRIGLYSTLFMIFSTILLSCHYYEQSNLNSWMYSWLSKVCRNREYSIPCPSWNSSNQSPHYTTFIMKHLANMAIGVISALFMLSEKTLTAYREVAELCNYKI